VHRLAVPTKDVLVVVPSLAADVTAADLQKRRGWGLLGSEHACAALRHEGVHQEVELDCAVVGGEGGGKEVEVVMEDVDQLGAVCEPPAHEFLLQVGIDFVPVAGVDQ
jgi:hypothetical protein